MYSNTTHLFIYKNLLKQKNHKKSVDDLNSVINNMKDSYSKGNSDMKSLHDAEMEKIKKGE